MVDNNSRVLIPGACDFRLKTVKKDVSQLIIKYRQEKGWTQKDLAAQIHEKPPVVHGFESGSALPDPKILLKLERALGVKLRGQDMGKPIKGKGAAVAGNGETNNK